MKRGLFMHYDFNQVITRHHTNSVKYDCAKYFCPGIPDDFIPMWVADMDFATPDDVKNAMIERIKKSIFGYTYITDPDYNAAIIGWMNRRFSWNIQKYTIIPCNGVVNALHHFVTLMTNPGEGVIIQPPVYPQFFNSIEMEGRKVVCNNLLYNDGYYTIDFDDLEQKAQDSKNTLMFVCSPHNPVGRVWTVKELQKIGTICLQNNVRIVCDEVHHDLTRKNIVHTPLASLFPDNPNIYTCTSPGKTFNLSGNNLANIITCDPTLPQLWSSIFHASASPLAVAAVQTAYSLCDGWVDELRAYLDDNFQYLQKFLEKYLPKAQFKIPEGMYLAWIDFSSYEPDADKLYHKLCIDAGVVVQSGSHFHSNLTGYIRMNIACPRSVLSEALNRIAAVL